MSVIGLRVGPFEIVEEASAPERGRWYLGRRTGTTRKQPAEVLVCLLPPDASAEDRAALQRRFEALRAVEGARVPEPVGFFEGVGALVVGAARGSPLSAAIDGRRTGEVAMTPATLLDVVLEIAETLQHAHHKGKVHGHLAPDHVRIGADGRVWLWGLAEGGAEPVDPAWCPPERDRGEPASDATDQWSLAAIAAALVTGQPPRDPAAGSAFDLDAVVEPVERQWPALGRTLRRMLDPRPANRFPTMHPVRQELLALARKAGGTSDRRELGVALAALTASGPVPLDVEALVEVAAPEPEVITQPIPPEAAEATVMFEPLAPDAAVEAVLDEVPADREPSDPGIEEVVVASASTRTPEDARRVVARLPEEQIPVVRPEVRGDVPTARLLAGRRDPRAAREAPADDVPADDVPADDVPAEATADDPPSDALPDAPSKVDEAERPAVGAAPPALALPRPTARPSLPPVIRPSASEADVEPSDATMLFDSAVLSALDVPEALSLTPAPAPVAKPPPRPSAGPAPAAEPPSPAEPATPAEPAMPADVVDPTLLATPLYPDRTGFEDDDHATVVVDMATLGGRLEPSHAYELDPAHAPGPTAVPRTDASEDDEAAGPRLPRAFGAVRSSRAGAFGGDTSIGDPGSGEWFAAAPAAVARVDESDGPSLGDVADAIDPHELPESPPSLATRAAPVLVIVMLLLMILYVGVRFF